MKHSFKNSLMIILTLMSLIINAVGVTPALAAEIPTVVVVSPATPNWGFANEGTATGAYAFVSGPADHSGSLKITTSVATDGPYFAGVLAGFNVDELTTLQYDVFSPDPTSIMPTLQLDVDWDSTDGITTWQGRLVFVPNGPFTEDTWQTLDALSDIDGTWFGTGGAGKISCPLAAPCTWSTVQSTFPNLVLYSSWSQASLPGSGAIGFKKGSSETAPFEGYVDNLTIDSVTYDFELVSTFYVDDDWASVTAGADPDGDGPAAKYGVDSFDTIQEGIEAAVAGNTIHVAAGTYAANVNITKAVTLRGAQYDMAIGGRTAAGAEESTIQGLVTVNASDVTINGFTLTNPGQTYALYVPSQTPSYSAITISYNLVENVGGTGLSSNVHAIFLNRGPDSVSILHNGFNNIKSGTRSASGIGVLDSVSTDASASLLIQDNALSDIASGSRGAYGIIFNNAAGSPGAQVLDNSFTGLSGGWTHAIGLEGPTPDAVVTGNVFSNLTATGADNVAIFFGKNTAGNTVTVSENEFNGTVFYGVAIHPNDLPGGSNGYNYEVIAESNWWGSDTGPGSVGSGTGALVSASVNYAPWCADASCSSLIQPAQVTLIGPKGNIGAETDPTYEWNPAANAEEYKIGITDPTNTDTYSAWLAAADVCDATTCSALHTDILPTVGVVDGNYTWWVQGRNTTGSGPWSDPMVFTIQLDTSAPDAPIVNNPAGLTNHNIPTIDGTAELYAYVNVWYWDGADYQPLCEDVLVDEFGAWSCESIITFPEGENELAVMAVDEAGNESDPTFHSFTVVAPPAAATLVTPSGNSGLKNPSYTWNVVPGATWYYLWVDGPSGNVHKQWYTAAQANCTETTCSVTPALDISSGNYTWWIQTYNAAGYGLWSEGTIFYAAPGKATLTSPAGSLDKAATYSWNAVPGATWYYLWVDGPSGNVLKQWYTAAQANCTETTCSVANATPELSGGTYTWWIQTWNDAGFGPWSDSMTFSPAVPGKASLGSPSGNLGLNNPTYSWSQVPGATWYYLWVDGPSGNVHKQWYKIADLNCDGTTCSIEGVTPNMVAGTYTWWIQTWNAAGYGPWSDASTFNPLPAKATLTSPSGTGTSNPTYTWDAVPGATWYYLWVNDPSQQIFGKWYTAADAGCENTTVCSIADVTPNLAAGTHTWWVQTWNETGYGPWSNGTSFSITP